MIRSFMTKAEEHALRSKSIEGHINLLKERYSRAERQEAVTQLRLRLEELKDK